MGHNSKQMREYMVTTGVVLAYLHTFDVDLFNLQTPSKDTVPQQFSQDYLTKILLARKVVTKKKPEKNLATVIK